MGHKGHQQPVPSLHFDGLLTLRTQTNVAGPPSPSARILLVPLARNSIRPPANALQHEFADRLQLSRKCALARAGCCQRQTRRCFHRGWSLVGGPCVSVSCPQWCRCSRLPICSFVAGVGALLLPSVLSRSFNSLPSGRFEPRNRASSLLGPGYYDRVVSCIDSDQFVSIVIVAERFWGLEPRTGCMVLVMCGPGK